MAENILCGFLILLAAVLVFLWIMAVCWLLTPFRPFKRFCHEFMGWHEPAESGDVYFDGLSFHTHCKYCGKEILQDSQGNWFAK
jgi:hypothetical protein